MGAGSVPGVFVFPGNEYLANYDSSAYLKYTGPMRFDRAMHSLEGLLTGIAIDQQLNSDEILAITAWLSEHREFQFRHPFNEVFPILSAAASQSDIGKSEYEDVLWLAGKLRTESRYYDELTSDLQRLQGILGGIACDGSIVTEELAPLQLWLKEREHLRGCWPYDEIVAIVAQVLKDSSVSESEHRLLLRYFSEFTRFGEHKVIGIPLNEATEPIGAVCAEAPIVQFDKQLFCFTGKSEKFCRSKLVETVEELGGAFSENVVQELNYLIVGNEGNKCWAYACYGRKVEKALEYRKRGRHITIAHEIDFWAAVEGVPRKSTSSTSASGISRVRTEEPRSPNPDDGDPPDETQSMGLNSKLRADFLRDLPLPLAGKTIVVTGTLEKFERKEIEDLIVKLGGKSSGSVSKKTSFVIAGESAGSKLDKAKELGVEVINEAEFLKRIGD